MKYGFFLISPTAAQSGLRLIVRYNGQRYTKCLKGKISTKNWDQDSQKYRAGKDGAELSATLKNYIYALNNIERNQPTVVNGDHFWKIVNCEMTGKDYLTVDPSIKNFTDYFETIYIPRYTEVKNDTRIQRLNVFLKMIKKLEQTQQRAYLLSEINATFFRHLQQYCTIQKYSQNYFHSAIKVIKQVMREAVYVDKLAANEEFRAASFSASTEQVDSVYLTDAELRCIHALAIDEALINKLYPTSIGHGTQQRIESYTVAKNLFLIGAYTGLRVSDFKRLSKEHFSDGKITIVTEKTKARVVIPIHPIVQDIIDNGFDLSQSLSEQKIRAYIKHICKAAGITEIVEVRTSTMGGVTVERKPKCELVSTHTARRSFATNAYLAGVPTLAIMKITGHTKESTFMRYIRISQEENANALANHPFFK